MHRYMETQDRGAETIKVEKLEYDNVQEIRGNAIKKGKTIFKYLVLVTLETDRAQLALSENFLQ